MAQKKAEKKADGPVPAALFDVDGTVADTNYLHVVSWWEAFSQAGYVVPMAEIHSRDELLSAGAAEVYPGPGDPLAALDRSLLGKGCR